MGLMDAITAEDRVQLKVSDLETLMKNAAKADLIFNGIRAEVPNRYMREIITGKKEEDADETKARKETGEQEHEPQTKPATCRGCFGASFGDCDRCQKERG